MKQVIHKTVDWLADATKIRVLPDRLRHPRDSNVETLKLKGYYQTQGHTCGFVAGLMILRYFRPDFRAEKFYDCTRPHKRWGVSRQRFQDCLRLHKVRATWRRDLDFNAVVAAIDSQRPIAVVVHTSTTGVKHWVVVYGYRRSPNTVFVAANGLPFLSHKEYPWGFFRREYWAMPGSGLVCAGPRDD